LRVVLFPKEKPGWIWEDWTGLPRLGQIVPGASAPRRLEKLLGTGLVTFSECETRRLEVTVTETGLVRCHYLRDAQRLSHSPEET
jgi:hypothetical protein